eukprot:1536479-Pleurochrysis_carterae.AAC.1
MRSDAVAAGDGPGEKQQSPALSHAGGGGSLLSADRRAGEPRVGGQGGRILRSGGEAGRLRRTTVGLLRDELRGDGVGPPWVREFIEIIVGSRDYLAGGRDTYVLGFGRQPAAPQPS